MDERKFNIFGRGRFKVWRKPNEKLEQRNLIANVIPVWGCFVACEVGNLHFIEEKMLK